MRADQALAGLEADDPCESCGFTDGAAGVSADTTNISSADMSVMGTTGSRPNTIAPVVARVTTSIPPTPKTGTIVPGGGVGTTVWTQATIATATTAATVPGWRLNFAAGFVPLIAGLTTLVTSWVNVARGDAPLWTGLGQLPFSYSDLAGAGPGAAAWLELNGSVGGVNIVAAAIAVSVVSRFALREGRRWAWWFLAFCLMWVGLHDATLATRFFAATGQPVMVLPYTYVALMTAGLLRSRRAVFPNPAA